MLKKKSILTFVIIFLLNSTILIANDKSKIIDNINNIETLKFNFAQNSFDKKEYGVCFMKRPHFLKCIYDDKNKKELIINRGNLVIYHKRYKKKYYYPVSKSYFVEILNKKKFSDLILKGNINMNGEVFEIKYSAENKGKITFFFNNKSFDLSGWEITDLNGNQTIFKIKNLEKNQNMDKKLFFIPEIN